MDAAIAVSVKTYKNAQYRSLLAEMMGKQTVVALTRRFNVLGKGLKIEAVRERDLCPCVFLDKKFSFNQSPLYWANFGRSVTR